MVKEWLSVIKGEKPTKLEYERAETCNGCAFKTKGVYPVFIKNNIKDISGYICCKCKCPLIAKIKTQEKKQICKLWQR